MAMKKGFRISTFDILMVAVVAAVGGVVGAFVVLPWAKFIEGIVGPFGAALNNPFFILFYIIIGLLTKKPGLTFIGGMLTGTIEVLAGSLDGSIVLVFTLFQAAGAELGFLLTRYRFNLLGSMLSGALACTGCAITLTAVYGFFVFPLGTMILFYLAMAAAGAVLGGIPAWYIYQAVVRTGVTGTAPSGV